MLASIAGPDILIVLLVLVVLFGGSQLPKLARSLGSASNEFKRGVKESEGTVATTVTAPADLHAVQPANEHQS